jgi:hypothetical protein
VLVPAGIEILEDHVDTHLADTSCSPLQSAKAIKEGHAWGQGNGKAIIDVPSCDPHHDVNIVASGRGGILRKATL